MAHHHHHHYQQKTTTLSTMTASACLFLFAVLALNAHAQVQEVAQELPGHVRAEAGPSQGLTFSSALRQELMERGMKKEEVDNILYAVGTRLLHLNDFRSYKRAGWKRIPIQTRFAPFGTKLVPSRNRGDSNGPTLLRYGRSSNA